MKNIYYPVAHRDPEHINSFKTRYKDFGDSVIPQIFKDTMDLEVESWKKTDSWGTAHVIYFVKIKGQTEELVFRANTGYGEPEWSMLSEKLTTDLVLSRGLPSNKVLYVDISRKHYPFDFQIQEKLGGADPEVNFPDGQKEYDQLSFELGQYIAKLSEIKLRGYGLFDPQQAQQGILAGVHDNFYDYLTTRLDEDLEYLVAGKIINSSNVDQIIKVFEANKSLINSAPSRLVHHDLADHNLRYADGRLMAVFDWETAIAGDPLLDLASCPTWNVLYPREDKLEAGYLSVKELPDNFQAKKNIYRLRTVLWKMRFRQQINVIQPKHHKQFQTALDPYGIKL